MTTIRRLLPALAGLLLLVACDNVGRAFDPGGGGGGTPNDGTGIAILPDGGSALPARPLVVDAFPKGAGFAPTVPIVVVFNESMSRESITPDGGPAGVFLRVEGTPQALPATAQFLLSDTVVVLLPAAGLRPEATYEVVVSPDVRDVDGQRRGGTEAVVATFQPDAEESEVDATVVAVLPLDNARNVPRDHDVLAFFSRPAVADSLTTANFTLERDGVPVAGDVDFPLRVGPIEDTRIARFAPSATLEGNAVHDVRFSDGIRFPNDGVLDFGNRSPFSSFTTMVPAPPLDIAIPGSGGLADKINLGNLTNVVVDVEIDASVQAGDEVVVRIYGGAARTQDEEDVTFAEASADATAPGPGTVSVAFGTALGSNLDPLFDEGPIELRAKVVRGRVATSFVDPAQDRSPLFDITPPETVEFLPAMPGRPTDVATDQEWFVLSGRANEQLGSGELTAGGVTVQLFGSGPDGGFVFEPLHLGRRAAPLPFTVAVTDAAGNSATTALSGRILQRGLVTGTAAASLTVEVFDEATLAPVANATVLVEPGLPQKPPVAGRVTALTNANGRAVFTSLAPGARSITVVAAGFHLTTLLDVASAYVSLPIRAIADEAAFATLTGQLAFVPTAGQRAMIGSNLLPDPFDEEILTAASGPTLIPETPVRAGRPMAVNAFTGVFEPTGVPTFGGFACHLCGVDANTRTGGVPPLVPDETAEVGLVAIPATGGAAGLAAPFTIDFATVPGLGTLDGAPTVRVVSGLRGFAGTTLFGVGLAANVAGSAFAINSTHTLALLVLDGFTPNPSVSVEAHDDLGGITRVRRPITNVLLGTTDPGIAPLGLPTLTLPASSTGAPQIGWEDRLDATVLAGGLAWTVFDVEDATGRRWSVRWPDRDGATGARTVQLPVLDGVATGLALGEWTVTATNVLAALPGSTHDDHVLAEPLRTETARSRTPEGAITVQ